MKRPSPWELPVNDMDLLVARLGKATHGRHPLYFDTLNLGWIPCNGLIVAAERGPPGDCRHRKQNKVKLLLAPRSA